MPDRAAVDIDKTFAFDKVLFFGRTLADYVQMFNLDLPALTGLAILDCAGGPASFAAEAHELGIAVTACDPMYGMSACELKALHESESKECLARQARVLHLFEEEKQKRLTLSCRQESLGRFLLDFASGLSQGRYRQGSLPSLPFADGQFDMALTSNFLFLYGDYFEGGMRFDSPFDYNFHVASVRELIRVARQAVRIYPLKGPHSERMHPYVSPLMSDLGEFGLTAHQEKVPYKDIKGADEMLVIRRA